MISLFTLIATTLISNSDYIQYTEDLNTYLKITNKQNS